MFPVRIALPVAWFGRMLLTDDLFGVTILGAARRSGSEGDQC